MMEEASDFKRDVLSMKKNLVIKNDQVFIQGSVFEMP